MQPTLTPDEGLELILDRMGTVAAEVIPLGAALERTLAGDLAAPFPLPPFDNSAMDGYALQASDLALASPEAPVRLRLREVIAAGAHGGETVTAGTCSKIMTGSPIPPGADTVVMHEETVVDSGGVRFTVPARPGLNLRHSGSDVREGQIVLRGGDRLDPAAWALLGALGQEQVSVYRRPKIVLLITGAELVTPGTKLLPGQIYDSNAYALEGLARASGAEILAVERCGDEEAPLRARLEHFAPLCDAIVTSGGVSAGDFDPVRDVLLHHAQVHFWKLAMKPGKPLLFASYHGIPVFALPGNPASAMVVFEEFVRPALLKLGGRTALHRPRLRVVLDSHHSSPAGRMEFVRARVCPEGAIWKAHICGDQGSGRLASMVGANALLRVPADCAQLAPGDIVFANLTSAAEIQPPSAP